MTDYEETIPFYYWLPYSATRAIAQITDYSIFDKKFNFYVANDLGATATTTRNPLPN